MDSLEKETVAIFIQGTRICPKGIKDSLSACPKIKIRKLRGLIRQGGVAQVVHFCPSTAVHEQQSVPEEVQQLIDANASLFQHPYSLPPSREFIITFHSYQGSNQ